MAKIQCVGHFMGKDTINNQVYFLIEADDNNGCYKGKPLRFLIPEECSENLGSFKRYDTLSLEGEIIGQSNQGIFMENIDYRGFDNE
jgi:hypothetical protein